MQKTIYSLLTVFNKDPEETDVMLSKDYKDFVEEVLYRSNYGSGYEESDPNLVVYLQSFDREEGQEEENKTYECIIPNTPQGVENFLNEFTDKTLLQDDKYKIETHQI